MMAPKHTLGTFTLLVVIALALTSVPTEASGGMEVAAESDACCAQCDEPPAPSGSEKPSAPVDEDCCQNGCPNCFLPCCAGGLVAFGTSLEIQGPHLASVDSPARYDCCFSSGYPGEIFHPPHV